ncbi:MAG TPA: ATP-grasp domain-containing protein [Candidatus Dormibacteraeota bacterium]|nr:ATP-grasp domain-containing protein [Candidatus Dormibacteraeota bacterium]
MNRRPGAVVLGSDFRALAVVRSLARRGVPCALVDNLPRSAWFSRHVVARVRWRGPMDTPDFGAFLLRLGRDRFRDWVLFPMSDDTVALVAEEREQLRSAYRLTTPPPDTVRLAQDKRRLYALAEELGVPAPRTCCPATADELVSIELPFPVVVKPANSASLQAAARKKALAARDPDELLAAYRTVAGLVGNEGLMVQELIPGDGASQFSVGAFCRDGHCLVALTVRRRRQFPVDFGLGSCFVESVEVPELIPLALTLIERMRLSGMVEVEFKRDPRDRRFKVLDVNPRAWGWHGLCRDCGVDLPHLQYLEATGAPLPECRVRYGPRWRRLLTDLPAALVEMRSGTLSPLAYARSFLGPTSRSVLDLRDPLPALGDVAVALGRLVGMVARGPRDVRSVRIAPLEAVESLGRDRRGEA